MDHYNTLGVSKTATAAEIKQAYRKLAAQHHPDRGGDTAKFQSIQQAYDILGDEEKRQQYDNPPMRGMHGQPFGNPFGQNFGNPFGDPFQDIINRFTQQSRQQIFTLSVMVTLEQIAQGGVENVQINTPQGPKLIQLQIPKGIDENQQCRYENIIPNAFLQVNFRTHKHHKFERHNLDLQHTENVNVFKLITGTTLVITDILNNKFEMHIPPMTKPGTKFRLSGRGLSTDHQTGDHYVLIQAEIPDNISTELHELIKQEVKK